MVQPNSFEQNEQLYEGRLKFILCPHCAEWGRPDEKSKFINLVDEPGEVPGKGHTVILVLCGVCKNVVTGALAEGIVRTIAENDLLKLKNEMLSQVADGFKAARV